MFETSLKDRAASFRQAPGTSVFIHWLVGMVYVFYFASFILLLREVLRPGVLWFLRNLNDPEFNPINEVGFLYSFYSFSLCCKYPDAQHGCLKSFLWKYHLCKKWCLYWCNRWKDEIFVKISWENCEKALFLKGNLYSFPAEPPSSGLLFFFPPLAYYFCFFPASAIQ